MTFEFDRKTVARWKGHHHTLSIQALRVYFIHSNPRPLVSLPPLPEPHCQPPAHRANNLMASPCSIRFPVLCLCCRRRHRRRHPYRATHASIIIYTLLEIDLKWQHTFAIFNQNQTKQTETRMKWTHPNTQLLWSDYLFTPPFGLKWNEVHPRLLWRCNIHEPKHRGVVLGSHNVIRLCFFLHFIRIYGVDFFSFGSFHQMDGWWLEVVARRVGGFDSVCLMEWAGSIYGFDS